MNFEPFISSMMSISVLGRLWHWTTDTSQHHRVFEDFLTKNEDLTDSFVESILGNDLKMNIFEYVGVKDSTITNYNLTDIRNTISNYRDKVINLQNSLNESDINAHSELVVILDDVVELCSKTLYLLKLK